MRYIDISQLELPDGWQEKADALKRQLEAAPDNAARAQIIKKNPIWTELFVPLQNLSHGKCWYSEAKEVMSDRDVDHFRPKNEALNEDDTSRDGYWWLAYDWENYRFSSIYSNRLRKDKFDEDKDAGGKGCYFPLFPGSNVATTKARLRDEDIMLLDPTDEDDPCLITFDNSGKAIPSTNDVKEAKRVNVSIKLYHLDHTPLEEARQDVWNKCQRYIDRIATIQLENERGVVDDVEIKFLRAEIRKMTNTKEEFSAVAKACIEHNKQAWLLRA